MSKTQAQRSLLLTALLFTLASIVAPVEAQTLAGRPFRTESASTLEWGEHALEFGGDYMSEMSPLPILDPTTRGDYWRAPTFRHRVGLGPAEFILGGPIWTGFDPKDPALASTDEIGDGAMWIKLEGLRETDRRPGLGIMFGAKFPNASNETRLGTDEADLFVALLASKSWRAHELRFNVGLAILGDPLRNGEQEDIMTFGLAGRHGVRHALLWEVWGRAFGDDQRDIDEATARLGYGWFGDSWEIDVALLFGLEDVSGEVGGTFGATWRLGKPHAR